MKKQRDKARRPLGRTIEDVVDHEGDPERVKIDNGASNELTHYRSGKYWPCYHPLEPL